VSSDRLYRDQPPGRARYFDITRDESVGPGDESPPENGQARALREKREGRDTFARRAREHADAWLRGDA
jgi:hypothetical protein